VTMNRELKSARIRAAVAATVVMVWGSYSVQAGTSKNTAGPVQQGQSDGGTGNPTLNNPAITISFSGQTALRSFDTSPGITDLAPNSTIVLHDGTLQTYTLNYAPGVTFQAGSPVSYIATNTPGVLVQLANANFGSADLNAGTPASPSTLSPQIASAIRTEWHEQGSVDGFYDLVNDEVGYSQTGTVSADGNPAGPISNESLRVPSLGNPTWINTGSFTAGGSSHGFVLDSGASDNLSNTYNATIYNPVTGVNIQGGQNRIQFAVGEPAVEAVANSGGVATFTNGAGAGGYGLGNPALNGPTSTQVAAGIGSLTSLGAKGARQQFQPATILNESSSIVDPQTSTSYTKGPWNSGTINNVTSTDVAVTAVTYSANPGTGLSRLNKGDSQWLQTTGRLQNGALFNVVARTVDTGQRIVFALNTGVDPSWAVGSNDDGNTTSLTNLSVGSLQDSIGSTLRFSGKTSGTLAEKTIASSRMAVGALSVPEARGAASNAPVRVLSIDFNDLTDANPNSVDASKYIAPNFDTIVSNGLGSSVTGNSEDDNARYAAVLISHYNTVKSPNLAALNNALVNLGLGTVTAATADGSGAVSEAQLQLAWSKVQSFDPKTAETDGTPAATLSVSGIKGDPTGDVAAFISNIVNSAGTAAAGLGTASVNNPSDNLFVNGFLIPGLLDYTRAVDGANISSVTLNAAALTEQQNVKNNYGFFFTTDSTPGAGTETIGTSAHYGDGGLSYNGQVVTTSALNGTIAITAKDSSGNSVGDGTVAPAGNYLFGNFNQNGVRDYSAVLEAVNAALSLHHVDGAKDSIFTADGGVANSTPIPSLTGTPGWVTTGTNTKGDLITLGDYNGDGKFDGYDIYLLAKGASLASTGTGTTLNATATTFADVVRNPNNVLRKNAALDTINGELGSTGDALFLRQTAAAVLTGATVPSGGTLISTNADGSKNYTFDPNGVNAFNKFDVNRDGKVNRQDAQIVDYFIGKNYHNLSDTLNAVVRTDLNDGGTAFVDSAGKPLDPTAAANASIPRRQISLVDVELNDTGDITEGADFKLIRTALGSSLTDGDSNFDGTVNIADFNNVAANFGSAAGKWSLGDFNLDGVVNALDLNAIATNFGVTAPAAVPLGALVPEPASIAMVMIGMGFMRRRRK
jgi:hypothetical protein